MRSMSAVSLSVALLAGSLAGCSGDRNVNPGALSATLTATDSLCSLSSAVIDAGTLHLRAVNKTDKALTVQLAVAERALPDLGRVEQHAEATFTKELAAGAYVVTCAPFGTRASLNVSGSKLPSEDPARAGAVRRYRDYVQRSVTRMIPVLRTFADAVRAGDVPKAKATYAASRVGWEAIEPVAAAFGTLDPRLDAREVDVVPGQEWSGWHRLEKALWVSKTTQGVEKYADQLERDVIELHTLIPTLQMTPVSIAKGAKELLEEVSATKVTGEEEAFSHVDLVDFGANIAGALQAFVCVKPLVKNQQLVTLLEERFKTVLTALASYRRGNDFVVYSSVPLAERKTLSDVVNGLSEPLSALAAAVA